MLSIFVAITCAIAPQVYGTQDSLVDTTTEETAASESPPDMTTQHADAHTAYHFELDANALFDAPDVARTNDPDRLADVATGMFAWLAIGCIFLLGLWINIVALMRASEGRQIWIIATGAGTMTFVIASFFGEPSIGWFVLAVGVACWEFLLYWMIRAVMKERIRKHVERNG